MNTRWLIALALVLAFSAMFAHTAKAENPANVEIGAWLVNVEKVDLASNSYRLDFYLWFRFNSTEVSLENMKDFEFINGAPSKDLIYATEDYLEYRVRGDFIKTFDFARYPFETHKLAVELEHKNLNASYLHFTTDTSSNIDETANVAGWNIGSFETLVVDHSYGDDAYSRFVFSVSQLDLHFHHSSRVSYQ